MESTIAYRVYIGIMEKENGKYYSIHVLYFDSGQENGNYYRTLWTP